jgi:hypothetical protein
LGNRIAFFNVNLSHSRGTFLAILDQIPARNGNDVALEIPLRRRDSKEARWLKKLNRRWCRPLA